MVKIKSAIKYVNVEFNNFTLLRHSSCYFVILLVAVASVSSESAASTRRSERRPLFRLGPFKKNRKTENAVQSLENSDDNVKRPSLWRRLRQRTSPSKLFRKQLALTTKTFYGANSSDPLHAYPTKTDLLVHKLFQQAATFEINNARAVRRALNVAQVTARVALIAGLPLVLAALAVSVPVSNVLGRRRADEEVEEEEPIDREDHQEHLIDILARNVVNAIQNGEFKFH